MMMTHYSKDTLAESRSRCAIQHQLDSEDMEDPHLVPPLLLNAARERQVDVILHAKDEMLRLYSALYQARFATLMADRRGIVTQRYAIPADAAALDAQGMFRGSDWRESLEGTNSIGTCLEAERALSVHHSEHFKRRHATLSSSAALVRAPSGEIVAAICAVACHQAVAKESQIVALAAVVATARAIEERMFRAAYPNCWVALLSDEQGSRYAFLALDSGLKILGADYYGRRSLFGDTPPERGGQSLDELFLSVTSREAATVLSGKALSIRRKRDNVTWNCVTTPPVARNWPRTSVESQSFRLMGSPCEGDLSETKELVKGGLSNGATQRVREYIRGHLPYDMPLTDLASIAEVSLSHFSREFKRTFGLSPHQYIVVKRIERAAHLITTTPNLFSDIALEVGFSDQSHFSRSFRQVLNITPRQFRRDLPRPKVRRRPDISARLLRSSLSSKLDDLATGVCYRLPQASRDLR